MSEETVRALNARLGITSKDNLFNTSELKSVEEMLENSRKEFEAFSKTFETKKEEINNQEAALKQVVADHNNKLVSYGQTDLSLKTFETALDSMTTLVAKGEMILNKLYDAITSTDIVDPDIIEASAKIIEGIRITISDIINFNTQKMQMDHIYRMNIDLENMKHQHNMERERYKSELRTQEKIAILREKLNQAEKINATVVNNNPDKVTMSYNDLMSSIRKVCDKVDEGEYETEARDVEESVADD